MGETELVASGMVPVAKACTGSTIMMAVCHSSSLDTVRETSGWQVDGWMAVTSEGETRCRREEEVGLMTASKLVACPSSLRKAGWGEPVTRMSPA